MKLVRFGLPGEERPGICTSGGIYDISGFGQDYGEVFFGTNGIARLKDWWEQHRDSCSRVPDQIRLGSPVARPSKIVCVGLNYSDHAAESGQVLPSEPILFMKSTTALCGPNDDVIIPKDSRKTDWEVELALVIGSRASQVSEKEAPAHIAGYCLHNDYSEREFQMEREGQWVKGKSCDTFAPLGPWLVTPDEIPDPHNLGIWLRVNDRMMQQSNTSRMIFKVPFLIHYISRFMTLLPGDVISTGTPPGVGLGQKPPIYLVEGDRVRLGIDGLGEATQNLIPYPG
ncbi:MAG TPA: fumarylacetoacetate hydrolase family protein [Chitinophagaceae bacterium]|nr:fumarylacetoacetate hydrolase family protein [Chitinophagaceae bacterium]